MGYLLKQIGFVGYNEGAVSLPTKPDEAAELVKQACPDALAVEMHLQTSAETSINRPALKIEASLAHLCCMAQVVSGLKIGIG